MLLIGIDDTDTKDSRGTGRLARTVASELSRHCNIYGVTRHQLLVHPDIPYTSHNSCAVIHADASENQADLLYETAKKTMLADFIQGSDPGIAMISSSLVSAELLAYSFNAKKIVLTQDQAKTIAEKSGVTFDALGGTGGGIIGAIAGVGLASTGNDGRFLLKGKNRELAAGKRTIKELLDVGIDEILTSSGQPIKQDTPIMIIKYALPAFVGHRAVLFVEEQNSQWVALKRD